MRHILDHTLPDIGPCVVYSVTLAPYVCGNVMHGTGEVAPI